MRKRAIVCGVRVTLVSRDGRLWASSLAELDRTIRAHRQRHLEPGSTFGRQFVPRKIRRGA